MSRIGRRRRVYRSDGNAKQFEEFFDAVGAEWWDVGRPFDYLVAWKGQLMLCDAKNPETGHDWTPSQLKDIEALARKGVKVFRLETLADAADMLGVVIVSAHSPHEGRN